MIPRTVKMAQAVASQLTSTQLENLGNIILNGYATTGPNTNGVLAWQYKETTTAPVPLPSVTSVQPMLRGWTTNYQEYYTQLQPNSYGVNPGDPTMFEYTVHSFVPSQTSVSGIINATGTLVAGSNYVPGAYDIPLTGGTGIGATGRVTVDTSGNVISFTLTAPGSNYTAGDVLTGDLPGGSGWSITVTSVTTTPAVNGGQPRWAQPPRRFFQNQVSSVTPPQNVNNPQVIQYSFMYPVADNPIAPPIDFL
jgi:hypothetical protein